MPWSRLLSTSLLVGFWLLRAAGAEPVPFSHRVHSRFQLKCTLCHTQAESGEQAGLPKAQQCLQCHETLDKPKLEPSGLNWQREARLPEFVFFRHADHFKGGVGCQECHQAMNEGDAPGPPKSLTMRQCLSCHRPRKATTECGACHSVRQ